jgi:hypothetical protein
MQEPQAYLADIGKPSVLGLIVNVSAEQLALEQREVVAQG